jgi:hypothetical protein
MDDIGNWEKKETKGNIDNLGKVAQNINTIGFKIQGKRLKTMSPTPSVPK